MNRPHSHRNLLWSGHWPVVFHKQTGTLLYSLFVSWSFYWQSNGRVDGFTMCTLSDAYTSEIIRFAFLLTDESLTSLAKKVPDLLTYSDENGIIDYNNDINTLLYELFRIDKKNQQHIREILASKE